MGWDGSSEWRTHVRGIDSPHDQWGCEDEHARRLCYKIRNHQIGLVSPVPPSRPSPRQSRTFPIRNSASVTLFRLIVILNDKKWAEPDPPPSSLQLIIPSPCRPAACRLPPAANPRPVRISAFNPQSIVPTLIPRSRAHLVYLFIILCPTAATRSPYFLACQYTAPPFDSHANIHLKRNDLTACIRFRT
jgi:hypothetical protein